MSKFFQKSQKKIITCKRIYHHYLKETSKEEVKPIKNYSRFFAERGKTIVEKLDQIYGTSDFFDALINEIKRNDKMAYKNDFKIEEYQSTLLEIMEPRLSSKNMSNLQLKYKNLNKKIFGIIEPKGRNTILADNLKHNAPFYLIEKLKNLDKENLLYRMKYIYQGNEPKFQNRRKKKEYDYPKEILYGKGQTLKSKSEEDNELPKINDMKNNKKK